MDTRWKRFRYGTEDRNPSWSFFGAVLCLGVAATAFALGYYRGTVSGPDAFSSFDISVFYAVCG